MSSVPDMLKDPSAAVATVILPVTFKLAPIYAFFAIVIPPRTLMDAVLDKDVASEVDLKTISLRKTLLKLIFDAQILLLL